jgi:hypothetical protein
LFVFASMENSNFCVINLMLMFGLALPDTFV